jgi:hypothetical protein
MRVAFATIALLLAFAVAAVGFAVSQGERDALLGFLTASAVLVATAFGLFGWSDMRWRRQVKTLSVSEGAAQPAPVSGASSTLVLVFGVVLAFPGRPMFSNWLDYVTRSGLYADQELARSYSIAEWPWCFVVGLTLCVWAVVWKVRLRVRAR